MATLAQLAQLCEVVKTDFNNRRAETGSKLGLPSGWERYDFSRDPAVSYFAEAFKNQAGEIVIATMGPTPLNPGVLTTWNQIANKKPTQDEADAQQFARKIARTNRGATIIETGYSRGGADAQAAVAALADTNTFNNVVSGVTFQAPGIASGLYQQINPASYNVLNFYNQGDVVQAEGGPHLGASYPIPAGPTVDQEVNALTETPEAGIWDLFDAHSIGTTSAYLGRHSKPGELGGLTPQQFLALSSQKRNQLIQGADNGAQQITVSADGSTTVVSDVKGDFIKLQFTSDHRLKETFSSKNGNELQETIAFGASVSAPQLVDKVVKTRGTYTQAIDASVFVANDPLNIEIGNDVPATLTIHGGNGIGLDSLTSVSVSVTNGNAGTPARLTGGASNGTNYVWADTNGTQYQFKPDNVSDPENLGTLTIIGGLVGNQIVIDKFNLGEAINSTQGYLGIHLANQVSLTAGAQSTNASPPQSADVPQGALQTFTVKVDAVLNKVQNLTLQLASNLGGAVWKLINGSDRSEERRVGKECRSRWSPYH